MSITTLTYDTGARPVVGLQPTPNGTITFAYDDSRKHVRCLHVHGVVTTCTCVDSRSSGVERPTVVHSTEGAATPESHLIAKLLILLRNPRQIGNPLWWHVWKTVAEDQWLRSQQVAIARRLVRQQQLIDEMCQFSTIHLGRVFERWPSLGLELDQLPSQFPRRARRIIRRDFVTWLRVRSNERRRMAPWPARDFVDVRNVQPIDELEIAAAMRGLSVLDRDVVEMRSVGYQRSEIARVLNISIFQVDRIFRSCREQLRRRLRSLRPD
jgi:DNA-directed RNA polymerase specialized sigma24 family protein